MTLCVDRSLKRVLEFFPPKSLRLCWNTEVQRCFHKMKKCLDLRINSSHLSPRQFFSPFLSFCSTIIITAILSPDWTTEWIIRRSYFLGVSTTAADVVITASRRRVESVRIRVQRAPQKATATSKTSSLSAAVGPRNSCENTRN